MKFNALLVFFLTTLVMFIGNLMSSNIIINQYDVENKWIFLFYFCIFFSLFSINFKLEITKNKFFFILFWEIFIITIFYSNILNDRFSFLEFILYAILIPLTFFSNKILNYKRIISLSYIVSLIPFLYVFNNENVFGILFCLGGIVLLNLLSNDRTKYLTLILFLILIYITGSRTALITFIIITVIQVFALLRKRSNSFLDLTRKSSVILAVTILGTITSGYIFDLIFNKRVSTSGNLTSGRLDIWLDILESKFSYFGSNVNYFIEYGVRDAHNIFIQVYADYGIFSFLLFILLLIYTLYKSIKIRRFDYFIFFTGYIILGLFEGLLFMNNRLISIHILFFAYLGCLINEKYKYNNKEYVKKRIYSKVFYR